MRIERWAHISLLGVFLALSLSTHQTSAQTKSSACGKPPKIISQPHSSSEDAARLNILKGVGTVAIIIGEDGSVAAAKVLTVSPDAAREPLLAVAKTIRFKPRPGCGTFQSTMIFSRDQQGRLRF
jgi:outer membrane biosynthesis protein TonB